MGLRVNDTTEDEEVPSHDARKQFKPLIKNQVIFFYVNRLYQ